MSSAINRPIYKLYTGLWSGLDWLYPPQCGGCGQDGSRWCPDCRQKIQPLKDTICQICGRVIDKAGVCTLCQDDRPPFQSLRSWAAYDGGLQNAIRRMKYFGDIALGEVLARPMLALLRELGWDVDLVSPVPAGTERRADRGYNQAALLALPIALGEGFAYRPGVLEKVQDTRSQVGLTFPQRFKNVAGAFRARGKYALEQRILVVDDVTTSGATMRACAAALTEAGASAVYGLALAQAGGDSRPDSFLDRSSAYP